MSKGTIIFSLLYFFCSCSALHHAAEYNLKTGEYKTLAENNKKVKMYLTVQQDSVRAYSLSGSRNHAIADTANYIDYTFPFLAKKQLAQHTFTQEGIDIDVLSIVFKYRPALNVLPPQLNTNFNAAGYLGYRWDKFKISYQQTPLKKYERKTNHFAYGTGVFLGLGATALNEYVTFPPIDRQYDGVVITKGITGIIGLGHLSFGAALGADMLLGAHAKKWAYNNKLWMGLNVGLNIN